jgi:hypothetical protein
MAGMLGTGSKEMVKFRERKIKKEYEHQGYACKKFLLALA